MIPSLNVVRAWTVTVSVFSGIVRAVDPVCDAAVNRTCDDRDQWRTPPLSP